MVNSRITQVGEPRKAMEEQLGEHARIPAAGGEEEIPGEKAGECIMNSSSGCADRRGANVNEFSSGAGRAASRETLMSQRDDSIQARKMEQLRALEIEEARNIQQAMVCLEPLKADAVEIASRFRPAAEVSGDFLDYFRLEDHRLGLYLGDVVGKGLAAAMYAALSMGTLRGIHKRDTAPTTVLELMNERLRMRVVPGRYCAVQYAVFDPATRELNFANAALPRPILVSPRGCREVGQGGLPSGLFADAQYERYSVQLEPGEAVLFCTDGIPEARDKQGDDFGLERVLAVCQAHIRADGEALLDRLFAEVDAFTGEVRPHDDMTAIVLTIS